MGKMLEIQMVCFKETISNFIVNDFVTVHQKCQQFFFENRIKVSLQLDLDMAFQQILLSRLN